MRFFVGVTDGDWFEYLTAMPGLEEVNFWRPSGQTSFRAIKPGELFLFKLHSPRNFIVGGGHFVTYSRLPVSVAWLAFGEKNGVRDLVAFRQLVDKYRRRSGSIDPSPDPVIGCTVLTEPFFWPRDAWIPIPKDWSRNIVKGKTYSTSEPAGEQLWYEVEQRLKASEALTLRPGAQDRRSTRIADSLRSHCFGRTAACPRSANGFARPLPGSMTRRAHCWAKSSHLATRRKPSTARIWRYRPRRPKT